MEKLLISLIFAATLAIGPASLLARPAEQGAEGPVIVVVPPWRDAETVIAAAQGRIIGPVRAPFAVFAAFETEIDPQTARHAGAWAVLDGAALAELCGVENV